MLFPIAHTEYDNFPTRRVQQSSRLFCIPEFHALMNPHFDGFSRHSCIVDNAVIALQEWIANLVYIRCQCWKRCCSLVAVNNREILRVLGRNIRQARLKAGLTQECLAELAGVHVQTVGDIERGGFPFAVTTFARIAQFLETSPNRLLDGLKPPDPQRTARIKKALARKRSARKNDE